jgi:hypothetical protein
MPSLDRMPIPDPDPLYTIDELIEARRGLLRYARSLPPGPERNQRRQIALSLRRLSRSKRWLSANT